MNLSAFIASRVFKNKTDKLSRVVSSIAVISIALGVSILIVSYSIFHGFTDNLKTKIFTFSGHLDITKFGSSEAYKVLPIEKQTQISAVATSLPNVSSLSYYARKPCLLKTEEGIHGIMLKGVDTTYPAEKLKSIIQSGYYLDFDSTDNKQILISRRVADKMRIELGDRVLVYFMKNVQNVRIRKLKVVGIYESEMPEFDDKVVLTRLDLIQQLNRWEDSLVGGYEIFIKDFNQLEETAQVVYNAMDYNLSLSKVSDRFYQIFEWFKVLDFNVLVLMVIIILVAMINVVSSFFIIILEKVRMIGTLKAFGASNGFIRRIFLVRGGKIMLLGLLFGNLIGLGLSFMQQYGQVVPLDAENYFMSYVPAKIEWSSVLLVNLLFIVMVALIVYLTTLIISTVKPVKSIRFN